MFGVIKIERIGGGFLRGFVTGFSARTRYRADKRLRQCSVFYADACV